MSNSKEVWFWRILFVLMTISFAYSQVELHEYRDATNDASWELRLYTMRYESCLNALDHCRSSLVDCRYEENKHLFDGITTITEIFEMEIVPVSTNHTEWEIRYVEE